MQHNRHIVLANPSKEDTPIQIYEYDSSLVVWVGHSPEPFTPKEGKTVKGVVDTFVS